MARIHITDTIQDVIFKMSDGNLGAATVVFGFLKDFHDLTYILDCDTLGLYGEKLYMLWNDCCGRDTKLAMRIAQFASIDDIRTHINYDGGRGFPFTEEELAALPK